MNKTTLLKRCLQTSLLLAAATLSARAGTFTSDFNSGLPAGTAVYGNAVVEGTGGIGDSGVLKLTKAVNSQQGSFVIEDLDAGSPIVGFDVSYKMLIGGGSGTPADGMSFCFGPDLPNGTWGEEGAGAGLRFLFDIYDNGNENPLAPSIDVWSAGGIVATSKRTIATISTNGYVDVHIRVNPDGSVNFDYRGQTLLSNFSLPNYQALVDAALPGRFGFGARTGGLNANQWVDDLRITTFLVPLVGISQQPFSQTVQQRNEAAFDVRVANINGVTYQWLSNNVPIAGATSQTLTITNVQPDASGSQYTVIATGPNNSVTSSVVTLTVTNLTIPSPPQLSFDFNDGLVPAGASLAGNALVDTTGGISNSGVLKLTINANGQSGAMVVTNSAEAGLPVYGFTARFKALVGGGTVPPADGFAFAFGNDIPDAPTGDFESGLGLGNGLRVTFDIFNNDGIFGLSNPSEPQPAPSIDVRFGNQVLGTARFPISFMQTGINDDLSPRFQDTIIQLNTDGTINVVYHGALVFDHLPVPGFSFVGGGRFAIAARTGGLNDNMWVDNFELTSVTNSGALRITTQPASQTVLVNHAATFSVGVNDTNGVTYQWLRSGTNIPGATASSYTLSPALLTDSGAIFAVQAIKGATLTSSNVNLTVVNLAAPVSPNLTFNFNDGLVPAGTALYSAAGGGTITPNGGVGDSGVLHLTDAVNGQQGAFVISNLYNGAQVSAIAASFDVRLGGGTATPADGFSFNFAANLTDGVALGEGGNGNGISILFDIFSPPFVGVRYKGALVASIPFTVEEFRTDLGFRTVLLRVDDDGKLYLSYGERVLFNGLQLPNYTFTANGKYGFYGRTGGLNENQWLDNILIKATQSSGPLSITDQPDDITVLAGSTAAFTVSLSDPNGATYQWQKQSAGGTFTNIPAATASSYTTPPTTAADNGARFRVNASGPSGSTTSSNALLTVVAPITIGTPSVIYDFNDGLVPDGTALNGAGGGGFITPDSGVTNSGVLHLTDAVNGQGGTFIIPDLNTNAPVKAFTVYFAALVGGFTAPPPADGFSFVWASSNDIPAGIVFGEDGTGLGLLISFDIYDNGGETPPAPSIDVRYKGNLVATRQIPYPELETGGNFADVFIRVNTDGTLDLHYNGRVIFNQVALPGYTALAGGEFAFGARTGGLNENQWFDNITIATTPGLIPIPIGFTQVGNNLRLTWGEGFKLQSTSSLTPTIVWTDVPGATSPYLAPMTGDAQFYRLAPAP